MFLTYEVGSGKVHWRYYPGKSSEYVSRFMHQVRRWYPTEPVWVALDQDKPHPRISRVTRRTMRTLDLHWVSLPKGCPDDNPVEAIFSGLHGRVLESSHDLDVATTRRRLSAVLRARNRRADRWIRIPYLPSAHSHKT